MKNTKVLSALALFSMLMIGLAGLAMATSGTGAVIGTLDLPAAITIVSCPSFVANLQTICTANIIGNNPTGIVEFSTNSVTGTFNPTNGICTVNAIGECNVAYTDTAKGSSPTITASYSGDGYNAESSNTVSVNVNAPVCTISTTTNALDLSGGAIESLNVINNGNYDGTVSISGTDWIGATSFDYFGVSNTLWGLASPTIPLQYSPGMIAIPALTNSTLGIPIYFSASAPPGTPADTYTQTITLTSSC